MGKSKGGREERAQALIAALPPEARARVAWGHDRGLQGRFRTWEDYKAWLVACLNAEAEGHTDGREEFRRRAAELGRLYGLKLHSRSGGRLDGGNTDALIRAARDRSFTLDYGPGFEALRRLFGAPAFGGRTRTTVTGEGAFAVPKRDQAMVVLRIHPEWSTSRIARHVGVSESSLEGWDLWRTARRSLRPGRKSRATQRL
jgi:hypothetical protein